MAYHLMLSGCSRRERGGARTPADRLQSGGHTLRDGEPNYIDVTDLVFGNRASWECSGTPHPRTTSPTTTSSEHSGDCRAWDLQPLSVAIPPSPPFFLSLDICSPPLSPLPLVRATIEGNVKATHEVAAQPLP